ncbi:hypothetical protein GGR34_001778 [Microvirga flocculans]|uniref:Homeodomain-like domain-containing protein n=1 Tax=Microvirga flocculans TaxID=217168 RepID=A0A7W6N7Y1_9HYPH|nr:hypothetical protein [Microvirga flocculans]MBB4040127.1 hypothetical protein [Microvirga flocculans]
MTPSSSFPAPSEPEARPSSPIREKLAPERIALMRDWVECTTRSLKRIGEELGVSASTVSRYATEGGWKRPAGAAPPPRIARRNPEPLRPRKNAPAQAGERREHIVDRLWALAERHAEVLESQPIERAERSLPPLARLTRTLGEMDKHRPLAAPPDDDYPDIKKPKGRTLHELRDELVAHLERIEREERDYEERWMDTFEDGGGI